MDGQLSTPLATTSYTPAGNFGGRLHLPPGALRLRRQLRAQRRDLRFAGHTCWTASDPSSAASHAAATKVVTFRVLGTYTVSSSPARPMRSTGRLHASAPRCSTARCRDFQSLAPARPGGWHRFGGLLRQQRLHVLTAKGRRRITCCGLLKTDATTLFRPRIDIYDSLGAQLHFLSTNDLDRRNFAIHRRRHVLAGGDGQLRQHAVRQPIRFPCCAWISPRTP